MNYAKYENYIRIGHNGVETGNHIYSCDDLENFPTPSSLSQTLADEDKDPFTDLQGYTHRNRVRQDVVSSFDISYNVLSDDDMAYILNRISPEWFYVELIDKKTKQKSIHKMYASDKKWDTFKITQDSNGNWVTTHTAFTVTFVEE